MNILITGGSGFIGGAIFKKLKKKHNLYIYDKSKPKFKTKFIKGNLNEKRKLSVLIKKNKIDCIIHLAASLGVKDTENNPSKVLSVNIGGTKNLLESISGSKVKLVLFSSSSEIYGETNKILREDDPIKPTSPYSKTKYAVEQILQDFSVQKSDWSFIVLRYFNPIGAHSSGIIGEQCKGKNKNIFPTINNVALGLTTELKIFGNDWDTFDGTCVRDYIHIMDLVDGHLAALDNVLNKSSLFSVFNLGTGQGTSLKELIKTFEKVNRIKIPFSIAPRRDGDVSFLVADASKALKYLNWKTKYNLEEMCRDGWTWYKKNNS